MSTIDPTKRAAVSWQDWDGPHSSNTRLTVAWLDEDNREMAQDIRGMHAYWMAQAFKARDAEIKQRGERIDALWRDLAALRLERDDYRRAWQRDLEKGREFLAERDRAVELLRELEWASVDPYGLGRNMCPSCCGYKNRPGETQYGHAVVCALAAFLAQEPPK